MKRNRPVAYTHRVHRAHARTRAPGDIALPTWSNRPGLLEGCGAALEKRALITAHVECLLGDNVGCVRRGLSHLREREGRSHTNNNRTTKQQLVLYIPPYATF